MLYTALKHLHLSFVGLTIALFLLRAAFMLWWPKALNWRWLRVTPHVVDSFLLLSAIGLMLVLQQYPFTHAWLTAKFLGLIAYIGFGTLALKRGRTRQSRIRALVLALLSLGYLIAVARTHSPTLGLF